SSQFIEAAVMTTASPPSNALAQMPPSPSAGIDIVMARRLATLQSALGAKIGAALADPLVTEILINADGIMWLDRHGSGLERSSSHLTSEERETAIRILATAANQSVSADNPQLSTTLPGSGARVQAMLPPLVQAPVLAIRKRPAKIFGLESYLNNGILDEAQLEQIRGAVAARKNIVVAGGTGSGKTTFLNALLAEPSFEQARVVLLEDTLELQCSAEDCVQLLTKSTEPFITLRDLVRMTLRLRPDRIVVGEVRDGAALDVLKAWNTGHPGGLLTVHANSAREVLQRLEDLCAEASNARCDRLVLAAVDLVVFIANDRGQRRIQDILNVEAMRNQESADAPFRPLLTPGDQT
ncbi:MAG: P-type conjugative transfer ATPase TrbB, partial [Caulobacterales bacterium]